MIKITDKTLSCFDDFDVSKEDAERFLELILSAGADNAEVSQKISDTLGNSYFPSVGISEIQVNDICEINRTVSNNRGNLRLCGLDDILLYNYKSAFASLRKYNYGRLELCPQNCLGLATATAVEWINSGDRSPAGSSHVVTTFGGVGNFTAFEEVIMALHVTKRYKPSKKFTAFAELRELTRKITGVDLSPKKAVIGEKIFDVEAGIHINGILKDPKIYEPFPPELVGSRRRIVLGKHSGETALTVKLKELNINHNPADYSVLLAVVRQKSIEKNRSLHDGEIRGIIGEYYL